MALRQELDLLNQFDTKDRALSTKMEKQQYDKKEVVTAITACKAKLAATQAEAEVCSLRGACIQPRQRAVPYSSVAFLFIPRRGHD